MTIQEEDYSALAVRYLENGLRLMQEGEVEKAGELLWGSVAAGLKAVAAQGGVRLRSHRDVRVYARDLAKETGEPGIWDDYFKAEHLHSNFYGAFLERDDLASVVDQIRRRVGQLLQMASGPV